MQTIKGKAKVNNFQIGKVYIVHLVDGDNFCGEYLRTERGFFVFMDEATKQETPIRDQNVDRYIEVCPCCQCNPCDCH